MSVRSARTGRPSCLPSAIKRPRQRARLRALGQEGAAADLHVHDQRARPFRDLLGQDRRRDQRDRLDGRGRVAQRVQGAIRRHQARGLAGEHEPGPRQHPPDLASASATCGTRGSPPACRACRRCGRARAPRSSAPSARTPPPAAPAAARSCRRRRPSSACRRRARAAGPSGGARPNRSSPRSRSTSSRVVMPRHTIAISSADSW